MKKTLIILLNITIVFTLIVIFQTNKSIDLINAQAVIPPVMPEGSVSPDFCRGAIPPPDCSDATVANSAAPGDPRYGKSPGVYQCPGDPTKRCMYSYDPNVQCSYIASCPDEGNVGQSCGYGGSPGTLQRPGDTTPFGYQYVSCVSGSTCDGVGAQVNDNGTPRQLYYCVTRDTSPVPPTATPTPTTPTTCTAPQCGAGQTAVFKGGPNICTTNGQCAGVGGNWCYSSGCCYTCVTNPSPTGSSSTPTRTPTPAYSCSSTNHRPNNCSCTSDTQCNSLNCENGSCETNRPTPPPANRLLTVRVFEDSNRNGTKDGTEAFYGNTSTVNLQQGSTNIGTESFTTGSYTRAFTSSQTITVTLASITGRTLTSTNPQTKTLAVGTTYYDFGLTPSTITPTTIGCSGTACGRVTHCTTGAGLNNVTLYVRRTGTSVNYAYTTNSSGNYTATQPSTGGGNLDVQVRLVGGIYNGWTASTPASGQYTNISRGSTRNFVICPPVTATATPTSAPTISYNLTGNVYEDTENNTCSSGATLLSNSTIRMYRQSTQLRTATGQDYNFSGSTNPSQAHTLSVSRAGYSTVGISNGNLTGPFTAYSLSDYPISDFTNTVSFCLKNNSLINSPWFMTTIGSVRQPEITNNVPAGQSPTTNDSAASVFYSTSGFTFLGRNESANTKWRIDDEYENVPAINRQGNASFTFYKNRAKTTGTQLYALPGCQSEGTPSNCTYSGDINSLPENRVYYVEGNLTLNNSSAIIGAKRYIFLANGNITINGSIILNNSNTLIIFAAKNNLIVGPAVGGTPSSSAFHIQSILTAENDIILQNTAVCPTSGLRLNIEGTLVANADNPFGIDLDGGILDNRRDLCSQNASYPSLFVKPRLSFIVQLSDFYKISSKFWNEVAP